METQTLLSLHVTNPGISIDIGQLHSVFLLCIFGSVKPLLIDYDANKAIRFAPPFFANRKAMLSTNKIVRILFA